MGASNGLRRTYAAFEIDTQRYERIGETAHTRTNGTTAFLTTWRTQCPDCGATFTFDHPERPGPVNPVRRCMECRKVAGRARVIDTLSHKRTHSKGNGVKLPRVRQSLGNGGVAGVVSVIDVAQMDRLSIVPATDASRMYRVLRVDGEGEPETALRAMSEAAQAASPATPAPASSARSTPHRTRKPGVFSDR